VVFVTHDIDESVYLSDRIIVLRHRPTSVKQIIDVPLPRPRDQLATKGLPEFAELRAQVFRLIKSERIEHGDIGPDEGEPART
jgi:NitT/TauT family transport system ATP-binding protein